MLASQRVLTGLGLHVIILTCLTNLESFNMEAVREITEWADGTTANHTYLLDGDKMVAYIPFGRKAATVFKNPIRIDKRGRKFEKLKTNPFDIKPESNLIEVQGSKGQTYYIDPEAKTCTCSGYTFRGACKHTKDL